MRITTTLALLALAMPAAAQEPRGTLLAGACQGCHGSAGAGSHGIPAIAGLHGSAEFAALLGDCGISIVGVYRGTPQRIEEAPNSGGIGPRTAALGARAAEHRRLEAAYADGWYDSITREMFGIA